MKNRSPCIVTVDGGGGALSAAAAVKNGVSSRAHVKLLEKMMIIIWASITLFKYYFFSNGKSLTVHNP